MGCGATCWQVLVYVTFCCTLVFVNAEDPYRFFTWNVTYGDIYPLGVKQQGILINGQFPGPDIYSVTNNNLIINVYNSLPEPFLISCKGGPIHTKMEYMERHVAIPPGKNFTYILQVKDQIGSFYYYPSLAFHKAAGGFGGIRILSMAANSCPFPEPAALIFTVLIGDWYKANHTRIEGHFRSWSQASSPDGNPGQWSRTQSDIFHIST
ncbi:hypothetical protein D5086_009184, partial [Populus alba]